MKKILVSLILIFSLFAGSFNYTNAAVSMKEKQKINQFVNNYFNKLEKKYGTKKAISKLREINRKVIDLQEVKTGRIRELLDVIQKEIANTLISVTLGRFIKDVEKRGIDTKYHLQDTIVYGNRTIKIYKRTTGRKYITDYRDNPYKSRYLLMKNDNDYPEIPRSKLMGNIRNEVAVKITSSIYGNPEETIFEKVGPDIGFCPHDSCVNDVYIKGIFNNKLFIVSSVNIVNGKYVMEKKYIYDFAKKKIIERDFGYGKISSGKKGIYYMRNNGTIGNYKNTKLILLDNNYNEKVIFEDTSGNYTDEVGFPFGSEVLNNFELLSNGRIKLFLRAINSKGKWYTFSKIIKLPGNGEVFNIKSLKKFLENAKSDFEVVMTYDNLDKINSCDYTMEENCIRDKKLEEKLKEFYNYIAKRQMDDAVKIAKNNPKILGMGFRAIDIRAIEESIDCGGIKKDLYLLEEGQDNGVYM